MPRKLEKARKKQLLDIALSEDTPMDMRYQAARELQYRRDSVLYQRMRRKA